MPKMLAILKCSKDSKDTEEDTWIWDMDMDMDMDIPTLQFPLSSLQSPNRYADTDADGIYLTKNKKKINQSANI